MALNEISNNTVSNMNVINNDKIDNKNNINSLDKENNLNHIDTSKLDSGLNKHNNDQADISLQSAKRSKEMQYASNLQNQSENSASIDSNYISQIVKKGKEVEKPKNITMDDVSWGLLVQLGEKIGVTSGEKLAKLNVEDLEAFFYTKHIIEKGKSLNKEYMSANDYADMNENNMDVKAYWDKVFDAKLHNKQYSINVINQDDTGLKISQREFFSNNGGVSVTNLSAASLHNILMAEVNTDVAQFTYAVQNISYAKKDLSIDLIQRDMIKEYDKMQAYSVKAISAYDQMDIIKKAVKDGNIISKKI